MEVQKVVAEVGIDTGGYTNACEVAARLSGAPQFGPGLNCIEVEDDVDGDDDFEIHMLVEEELGVMFQ